MKSVYEVLQPHLLVQLDKFFYRIYVQCITATPPNTAWYVQWNLCAIFYTYNSLYDLVGSNKM